MMNEKLLDVYREWPTESLILQATVKAHEYRPEAVEVMKTVLVEKGVDVEALEAEHAELVGAVSEAEALNISSIEGISKIGREELERELNRGAKFIAYQYCYSFIKFSVKKRSQIYFFRGGESRWSKKMKYVFFSLFFGWWAFPGGIVYTPETIFINLGGGEDLTDEVIRLVDNDLKYNDGKGISWLQ